MEMAYGDTKGVDSAIPQSLWGTVDNTSFYVYDYTTNSNGELVDLRMKLKFSNVKVAVTIVKNGDVLHKDKLPSELQDVIFHKALDYVFNNDDVEAFDIRPINSKYDNGGGVGENNIGYYAITVPNGKENLLKEENHYEIESLISKSLTKKWFGHGVFEVNFNKSSSLSYPLSLPDKIPNL